MRRVLLLAMTVLLAACVPPVPDPPPAPCAHIDPATDWPAYLRCIGRR